MAQAEWNYISGDDYTLEFLGYRFAFGARDFEERVGAAAVRLGLVASNDLDHEEVADLVELAADGRIAEARSTLGSYLVRHWERLALVEGESLVYWLRKLVFRVRTSTTASRRACSRSRGTRRAPSTPTPSRPAAALCSSSPPRPRGTRFSSATTELRGRQSAGSGPV